MLAIALPTTYPPCTEMEREVRVGAMLAIALPLTYRLYLPMH
jgi:hypothetical protein